MIKRWLWSDTGYLEQEKRDDYVDDNLTVALILRKL